MAAAPEILHYVGCNHDRGGIISVIRNLAAAERFQCRLGTNPGCVQSRMPALPVLELPAIAADTINPRTFWRARAVARSVQVWLHADVARVFHGHSRAGLLVALWLARWGERRVVVSVHCYGRRRWFFRWAARRLGGRLHWLSPAMKKYYGVGDDSWTQCIPGCVAPACPVASKTRTDQLIRLAGVGALVRWKRWDLVVAALARLPPPVRARVRFRHIGTAEDDADSRAFAAGLGEATAGDATVEWLGQQPGSGALLAESDCLVIASHQEPFSIAMLEALQAGVPVLAADSGGAVDIVRPGVNGWLFPSGDAAALAKQIVALADDPSVHRLDAHAIRRSALYADEIADRWLKVYQAR